MIRVFLLDDHALLRTGFRMIRSPEADIDGVGEAASGEEGLPLTRQLKPGVVVCDPHLPWLRRVAASETRGHYAVVSLNDGARRRLC